MGLAERTLSSNTAFTDGATSLSVSPTGMQQDDWLHISVISAGGTGAHSNTAGGMSRNHNDLAGSTTIVTSTWKKKCGAGESGPYTFSFGGSTRRAYITATCWSGGDPTDIVESAPTQTTGAGTSLATTGVDPAGNGRIHLISGFSRAGGGASQTFTAPTNYTEKYEGGSAHATNANAFGSTFIRSLPDDSATGDQTFTVGTSDRLNGASTLLKPGPETVALTPATMTFAGVAVTPVPQPVTVALTAASMTFAGVATNPVPQPVTVSLTPASMTFTAVPTTPQSAVNLTPATITLVGVVVDPVPQPVTVALTPAALTLTGVPVTAVPQPVTVGLTPAVMTFSAVALSPGGVSVVDLEPASTTLAAQPLDAVPGVITVDLTAADLTITAVGVDPVPQPVTVPLEPAVLTFTALPFVFGGGVVNLVPATLTFVAVPLFRTSADAITYLDAPVVVVTLGDPSVVISDVTPQLVESQL